MIAPGAVVLVHAHPDDEAIFTGGTMALLAAAGHRVVLVVATSGELGVPEPGTQDLGQARQDETRSCCDQLGVTEVIFLGYPDSGLNGENPAGIAHQSVDDICDRICDQLAAAGAAAIDSIVFYDDHGIYGHPDHVQVHLAASAVADKLGIATRYWSTVDREYLHFVETHVVVEAGLGERPIGRGLAASDLGMPSILIDTTVDVRNVLDTKRLAMAAHASQLPVDAPAFALGQQNFAAVYGYEWYARTGPPAALETLPQA